MLLLVKCYDNELVKSLIHPTIIPLVWDMGGDPIKKQLAAEKKLQNTQSYPGPTKVIILETLSDF